MKYLYIAPMLLLGTLLCSCSDDAKEGPKPPRPGEDVYVIITDYVKPDTKADLTASIQEVIDNNPNRTIYFPEGEYVLGSPVITPAAIAKSVSILLDSKAVIKASDNWSSTDAMIRLGGKDPASATTEAGSYAFQGGTVDGNGVADGISIESSSMTSIRSCNITGTRRGIVVFTGSNGGSADADIYDVNIIGNNKANSVGVEFKGLDNTVRNLTVSNVHTGVILAPGTSLITSSFKCDEGVEDYATSKGIVVTGNTFLTDCVVEDFATAYALNHERGFLHNCTATWSSKIGQSHLALGCNGPFNARISGFKADFTKANAVGSNVVLDCSGIGTGALAGLEITDPSVVTDNSYEKFLKK